VVKQLDERKLRGRHRNAYLALYIIGSLTLLLGLIAEIGRVEALLQLFGSGWVVAVEGVVLLALGYFTMRGSVVALGIAIVLYGLDALSTALLGGYRSIWIRLIVLFFLIQGFLALRELKRRTASATVAPAPTAPPGPATS
jgi:hypothetical protein